MKRIQIVVSADLPETNDKLADMKRAGEIASALSYLLANVDSEDGISASEPEIIEVRATRSDAGKPRNRKTGTPADDAPTEKEVVDNSAETNRLREQRAPEDNASAPAVAEAANGPDLPEIPAMLRREKVSA